MEYSECLPALFIPGETGFINMRFDCHPSKGKILVFHNCYPGTCSLHPDSLHSGKPGLARAANARRPGGPGGPLAWRFLPTSH
jgi:hypothetical protein